MPIAKVKSGEFQPVEGWEWILLLCFPNGLKPGSAAQAFDDFDPATGVLTYMGEKTPYTFSALLGLNMPDDTFSRNVAGVMKTVSYREATDQLTKLIHVEDANGELKNIDLYSLVDDGDMESLKLNIQDAYKAAGEGKVHTRAAVQAKNEEEADTDGIVPGETIELPPFDELIGIDESVYRQIEAALNSGKQHLMFYGPPGTGKTTLARRVAGHLAGRNVELITGSSDWSSQDIIGGYQPMESGSVKFFPGFLLKNFDRPVIFDELNRCDIDKVIGPLFTVLSGHATMLPYRVDASDANSPTYAAPSLGGLASRKRTRHIRS